MADSGKQNNYKVRLVPISSLAYGSDPSAVRDSQVAFDVTPSFSESRSAEYSPVTPVHMPGAIQVYKHTNSRNFEITAHLVSRNVADALKNMADLQKLRAWLLPYFGKTDTLSINNWSARQNSNHTSDTVPQSQEARDEYTRQRIANEGVQLRGAPPDVLYLYAYSSASNDIRGNGPRVNINRVPVVMTNLSIPYPEDVDYIPVYNPASGMPTGSTEPFPRKLDVTISLVETHSPHEYEQFDLMAYKQGNLVNF